MSEQPTGHVLLVDDSADILDALGFFLEVSGFEVSSAANGHEALERLKGLEKLPNAIVLDMMMPEMDGFAFRREQLKDPRLKDIPLIVTTALPANVIGAMNREDFPQILEKPISRYQLMSF